MLCRWCVSCEGHDKHICHIPTRPSPVKRPPPRAAYTPLTPYFSLNLSMQKTTPKSAGTESKAQACSTSTCASWATWWYLTIPQQRTNTTPYFTYISSAFVACQTNTSPVIHSQLTWGTYLPWTEAPLICPYSVILHWCTLSQSAHPRSGTDLAISTRAVSR